MGFYPGARRVCPAFRASRAKARLRDLYANELQFVTGAGDAPCPPTQPVKGKDKDKKGNNGFGNGADANTAAPGNSGATGGGKEGSVGDTRGRR